MGRNRIEREKRRVNLCVTISPKAYDCLDELADNYEVNVSQMTEKLIHDFYENWMHAAGMKSLKGVSEDTLKLTTIKTVING
jgi:hypothetical protein